MSRFKTYLAIVITIISAIGLVATLTFSTQNQLERSTGFNRKITATVKELKVITTDAHITSVAGFSKDHIFFTTSSPYKIGTTSFNLDNLLYHQIDLPNNKRIESNFNMQIDSPYFYLFAGNLPGIFTGEIGKKETTKHDIPKSLFTRSIAISPNQIYLRSFKSKSQLFLKANIASGSIEWEDNLSEKNNDGGIETDGLLNYDKKTSTFTYVQAYNNKFLCFDSNLHVIYSKSTIDTFASYQNKTGGLAIGEKIKFTNITAKRIINRENCTDNGFLFNVSTIKADNDENEIFGENSTIDMYRLNDGSYYGSFYIPNYNKEKMRRFRIINDVIIAIYKSNVVKYKLAFSS
jgi:hypothetical protein